MTSISSESTLTVTGSSDTVEDRLRGTLEVAERVLTRVSRMGRMHQRATTCTVTALVLLGAGFYLVAGITVGKQASFSSLFFVFWSWVDYRPCSDRDFNPHRHRHLSPPPPPPTRARPHACPALQTHIATAILGGAVNFVALYLSITRGSREPEASLVRTSDLDTFIADLRAVIRDRGREPWSETRLTPEMGARLEWNERRFVYEDAEWSLLTRRPHDQLDNSKDDGRGSGSAV